MIEKKSFELVSHYQPQGDQPNAIAQLVDGITNGQKHQVLLGATGTGKTFTMANVIARVQRPTLILCHNKTLAAQLYSEFREFFPHNAVEYFVSYYDYYQPEAYLPSTDTYIEKDSQINEQIDQLRHSATRSLLERKDCIIVSSVSCIYGLGSPEAYEGMILLLEVGAKIRRQAILAKLQEIQYKRNDVDFHRGTFRVRGDIIDVFPSYEDEHAVRIELFDDEIETISILDPLRGTRLGKMERTTIFPASHYVTPEAIRKRAMGTIRAELQTRVQELVTQGRAIEAKRLDERTQFDLEMMESVGFCSGIENYSRHLTGRAAGEAPPTLLDYFPQDFLLIIDEGHVTIPQVGGMYRGDRARKLNLVEHGFRLPSALDNRPLNFQEFESRVQQAVYVSATPGDYELEKSGGEIVEQVIRPTGLLDPIVTISPARTQVEQVLLEIHETVARQARVLITTLTKKFAEDLCGFLTTKGVRVKYLHSDIETLERIEILRDLRLGAFDVLVGINLLREGLDLPEVELVAIMDADKEGFLRSPRSLIQTIGRAARNENGRVILFADSITKSMNAAITETARRRAIQEKHNSDNKVVPRSIRKAIHQHSVFDTHTHERSQKAMAEPVKSISANHPVTELSIHSPFDLENQALELQKLTGNPHPTTKEVTALSRKWEREMKEAAHALEFERAAEIRNRWKRLKMLEASLLH